MVDLLTPRPGRDRGVIGCHRCFGKEKTQFHFCFEDVLSYIPFPMLHSDVALCQFVFLVSLAFLCLSGDVLAEQRIAKAFQIDVLSEETFAKKQQ